MLALLSGVMYNLYILSGENLPGVYSTTRRLRDQNTMHTGRSQAGQGRDPMCPIAPSSSMVQMRRRQGAFRSSPSAFLTHHYTDGIKFIKAWCVDIWPMGTGL
jgi:hypothetical protein